MRLCGYSVVRRRLGPAAVHLPLGDLTVLLGANDTGKSTLLRALSEDLAGRSPVAPMSEAGALFAELSDDEFERMLPNDSRTSQRAVGDWRLGNFDVRRTVDLDPSLAGVDRYVARLRAWSTAEPFDAVLDRLRASRLVCFEYLPDVAGGARGEWAGYWCLPALDTLDTDVAAQLRASDLIRFARAREGRETGPRSSLRTALRPLGHLIVEHAPVVVAPLATVRTPPTAALAVPASFSEVHETLSSALIALTWEARNGLSDAWNNREIETVEEAEERRSPGVLVEGDNDDGWRPARAARGAVRLINERAQRQMPEFVADRYRLAVELRPVDRWLTAPPLDLSLTAIGGPAYQRSFPVDEVADGLKLWVQLAMLAAVDDLDRVTDRLRSLADAKADEMRNEPWQDGEEEPGLGDDRHESALADLADLADPAVDPEPLLDPGGDWRAPDRLTRPVRVLLADEPERHLHPRLQRQAARWLADLVDSTDSPCVVASHSPAFLSLPAGVQMVHIARRDGVTRAEPFDATAVDELATVAEALGFDRGELLAGVSCFLLVEGEHDVAVLEAVFGARLRACRIVLVPLRGSPPKGLLEVDALWRFTSAAVAVALDNVRGDVLGRARGNDPEALRDLRHARSSEEEKAIGNLLEQAARHGRELHVLAHPGVDLVDALDPRAIKAVYGDYPETHAEAQAAWGRYRDEHDAKASSRKKFLQDTYAFENSVRSYRLIGEAHAELGIEPTDLSQIVEEACAAGLAADLQSSGTGRA